MEELSYGDECLTKEEITIRKVSKKTSIKNVVPPGSKVTIVSVSTNMAIVSYRNESFSTRIDNLVKNHEP